MKYTRHNKRHNKKHSKKSRKRVHKKHMKGGNAGLLINSPLQPNETLTLDNVPGPFVGYAYDGGAESTWPGVGVTANGGTQANYYALNKGYDTNADPVGYLESTNLGSQKGGMLRNSLRRLASQGVNSLKRVGPELVKHSKELSKEIGKDLADKSVKRVVKGSPMTPLTNKVKKMSSVAKQDLEVVKSKLFGGKRRKTHKKKRGGSVEDDKNLRNLQQSTRRRQRRSREAAEPHGNAPFASVEQAKVMLTRHLDTRPITPERDFLIRFIKAYVQDSWGFEGRPQWSREHWESEITRVINDEEDLMWNLDEMRLLPSQGAERDHEEYLGLRNEWRDYNRSQQGGGLIPQDIVNLGRSLTTGLGNVYNSVSGQALAPSPLPYKDQPIANKAPILVNMPPNYGQIYKNSNLEVGSIN